MAGNATHKVMQELHGKLAESISNALDDDEFVSPALFTITAKFLKDNEITCQGEAGDKINKLDEQLKQARAKRLASVPPMDADTKVATC